MDNGNPNVSCLTNLLADGPENAGNVIKNILVVIDQYKHNGPVWKALGGDNLDKIVELFSGKCRIEFSRVPNLVKSTFRGFSISLRIFLKIYIFFPETEMPFDAILSGVIGNEVPCELDLLSLYVRLLKPDGRLMVKCAPGNEGPVIKRLKMCGFLNITANSAPETEGVITGFTPTYKVRRLHIIISLLIVAFVSYVTQLFMCRSHYYMTYSICLCYFPNIGYQPKT